MSREKYPNNENTLGGRLRSFRKSKGLTTPRFAKLLEISQGSLSEIENDKRKPSSRPLANLILKTDINIYWLYTGKGDPIRDSGDNDSKNLVDSDSFKIRTLEKEVESLKEQMASLVNLHEEDMAREGHK